MERIARILEARGPLTGAELLAAGSFPDVFLLWRECHAPGILLHPAGHRYMRMDSAVEGYARLSPSIRREFLTYTVIGLASQRPAVLARAATLGKTAATISREKLDLARESVCMATASLPDESDLLEHTTFLIAGDITYNMAHRVPRPEHSSALMVRGSDLDIIIVADDTLPPDRLRALDDAIYRQKHYLLTHPSFREEIDYILKPLSRVREQLAFDTFEHMIACKILCESRHLYGSPFLFRDLMALVESSGVRARLRAMEQTAIDERSLSEQLLLDLADPTNAPPLMNLFYTREEGDEIY